MSLFRKKKQPSEPNIYSYSFPRLLSKKDFGNFKWDVKAIKMQDNHFTI